MKQIITLLFISCTALLSPAHAAVKEGESMPKLAPLLSGTTLPSTSGKVILVDFWASWCGPCKQAFPVLNKLHNQYASKGLVIIGIGVDDEPAKFKSFTEKMKPSFSVAHDAAHKAAAAFGPSTMPTSYLIDRKGVIRHIHTGFKAGKTDAAYTTEIEALLAEKK